MLIREDLKLSGNLEVTPPKQVRVCYAHDSVHVEVGASLDAAFMSSKVPCETRDGTLYFLFHISSAMRWIKALVSVYNSVKASTEKRPTDYMEWYALTTQLEQLHHMVYDLGCYYDAILNLTDLVNFLRNNLEELYTLNDTSKHVFERMILDY